MEKRMEESLEELKLSLERRRRKYGGAEYKPDRELTAEYLKGKVDGRPEREEYREYLNWESLEIDSLASEAYDLIQLYIPEDAESGDGRRDVNRIFIFMAQAAYRLLNRLAAEHGLCFYMVSDHEVKQHIRKVRINEKLDTEDEIATMEKKRAVYRAKSADPVKKQSK